MTVLRISTPLRRPLLLNFVVRLQEGTMNSITSDADACEVVYVLTNAAMLGLVKIGMTSQSDLELRLKQLYTTGVPVPFECYYACKVRSAKQVEDVLHFAFSGYRVNPNREFFRMEPEKVKAVLELVKIEEVTNYVEKELTQNVPENDRVASEALKRRRPKMNFEEMQIPIGSVLLFRDSKTTVTVHDARTVSLNGEQLSLTAATQRILGSESSIQPSPHWSYNGKLLKDIYDETYSDGDET
jgi:hypothetical protein